MNIAGKLQEVPLREIWKNEATDFTSWLSQKENLDLLAKELGIPLELIEQEKRVGDYSADIVAKIPNPDAETEEIVVIENMLEKSDHDHIGKIITYASGVDAKICCLICKDLRDEHRTAINWLNRINSGKVKFFAVRLEAYRIDNSNPAPAFTILCQPDEWAKSERGNIEAMGNITETKRMQYDFWKAFESYLKESKSPLRTTAIYPQHWFDCRIGSSKGHISFTINTNTNIIGCELYMSGEDPKAIYKTLLENKEAIEGEIGQKLMWMELPDKRASRIKLEREFDLSNQKSYQETFIWLKEYGEKFQKTFLKYLK